MMETNNIKQHNICFCFFFWVFNGQTHVAHGDVTDHCSSRWSREWWYRTTCDYLGGQLNDGNSILVKWWSHHFWNRIGLRRNESGTPSTNLGGTSHQKPWETLFFLNTTRGAGQFEAGNIALGWLNLLGISPIISGWIWVELTVTYDIQTYF